MKREERKAMIKHRKWILSSFGVRCSTKLADSPDFQVMVKEIEKANKTTFTGYRIISSRVCPIIELSNRAEVMEVHYVGSEWVPMVHGLIHQIKRQ